MFVLLPRSLPELLVEARLTSSTCFLTFACVRVNRAVNRKCELVVVGSALDGELMWSSEYIKSREVGGGSSSSGWTLICVL